MPLVSIVVPVHNTAPYLEECVNSLLAQTIADRLEIILVENASTDDSPAICRALAASHPATIRLLTLERGDLSLARNQGVKIATGRYIGFVDSDDTVEPNMFEQLVTAKETYNADIAYCNFYRVDDGGYHDVFLSSGTVKMISPQESMIDTIAVNGRSAAWIRLYDTSFFSSHSFPEFVIWEDHRVVYQWMGELSRVVHVDKPLYHYICRENSITGDSLSNPHKTIDFIGAEGDRISYILKYPHFTNAQRHVALNACVKNLIAIVVRYITMSDVSSPDDSSVITMRKLVLSYARPIRPWHIDKFQWLQLLRLRFTWRHFFLRQIARRDAVRHH